MTTLNPDQLRNITSFEDVIEYLTDELDWPIGAGDLEEATFDWDPAELGIPAERVPHLASLRQLRPLETAQPWGIFFLEFDGPRLPLTALRRLLDKLVKKKRAAGSGTLRTWKLDDLLFIITTSTGDSCERSEKPVIGDHRKPTRGRWSGRRLMRLAGASVAGVGGRDFEAVVLA